MTCFIIAALTADGFIAEDPTVPSTTWTSGEDKKWFGERTKQAGVVVMGRKTYDTIGRPLPGRLNVIYSSQPDLGNLPENMRYTSSSPSQLLTELEAEGYQEVAICGGSSIYTMFMKAGVVDKLYLTIEPVLFGQGVTLFTESISQALTLTNVTDISDQTKVMEYKVG